MINIVNEVKYSHLGDGVYDIAVTENGVTLKRKFKGIENLGKILDEIHNEIKEKYKCNKNNENYSSINQD